MKLTLSRKTEGGLLNDGGCSNLWDTRELNDVGVTRCVASPIYVTSREFKSVAETFLGIKNGGNFLSRGYIPDVLVVSAVLTMKIGPTVMHLFHEVHLV